MDGHRGLHQGFARLADQLAADVALDAEDAGGVIELLRHVLADASYLVAAGAGGAVQLMVDLGAGQLGRQPSSGSVVPLASSDYLTTQA